MLQADKEKVVADSRVSLLSVQQAELDFHVSRCLTLGLQSTLVAALTYNGIIEIDDSVHAFSDFEPTIQRFLVAWSQLPSPVHAPVSSPDSARPRVRGVASPHTVVEAALPCDSLTDAAVPPCHPLRV